MNVASNLYFSCSNTIGLTLHSLDVISFSPIFSNKDTLFSSDRVECGIYWAEPPKTIVAAHECTRSDSTYFAFFNIVRYPNGRSE